MKNNIRKWIRVGFQNTDEYIGDQTYVYCVIVVKEVNSSDRIEKKLFNGKCKLTETRVRTMQTVLGILLLASITLDDAIFLG